MGSMSNSMRAFKRVGRMRIDLFIMITRVYEMLANEDENLVRNAQIVILSCQLIVFLGERNLRSAKRFYERLCMWMAIPNTP